MAARARPLRAVFFDAGNTLVRMDYAAIAAALGRLGVRVAPADVERAEWRARVRLDADLRAAGPAGSTESRATAARYLSHVLDALGVRDAGVHAAMAAWRARFNPPAGLWTVLEPTAPAALAAVRAAGLTAAVVSNSNGSVRAILAGLGLADHLAFVIDSAEVGVEKPDPRIFQLALARAGVEAAEAVYVGDLYAVDVLGARAAGLEAILLDPGGDWGPRDCAIAPDVLAAVTRALEERGAPRQAGGAF